MLATLLTSALALCLAAAGEEPKKETIAAWVTGLGGEDGASCARQLSAAWPQARPAVASALERHEMPAVRAWCARILGEHAGEAEERALARAAQRDGTPRVRAVALQQLSKRPGALYLGTLATLIEWESDRSNLVTLLGHIERSGDLSLAGPVIAAIETKLEGEVEKAAFSTLRRLSGLKLPDDPAPWRAWWNGIQAQKDGAEGAEPEDEEAGAGGGGL